MVGELIQSSLWKLQRGRDRRRMDTNPRRWHKTVLLLRIVKVERKVNRIEASKRLMECSAIQDILGSI